MATAVNAIEVPLPAGALAAPEDVEVLADLFRAIVAVRFDATHRWQQMRKALERSGWDVRWSLQWHVEARRGRELEQACGQTLEQAFATVRQVAGAEEPLEGTP